eukprot:gene7571-15524_t
MTDVFDIDEGEVESSSIFKQAASDLTRVTNLENTLEKFGYNKDDRIERREMVLLYKTVEKEMENEIKYQAHDGSYDGAKEMRSRLTSLRREFDSLQTSALHLQREEQCALFNKASQRMKQDLSAELQSVDVDTINYCDSMSADLQSTHRIQWENLEKEIERIPRPLMKYSRRMIELLKSEAGLIKLCEYEEARKVRVFIDRLKPREERRFWTSFDAKIEARREDLRTSQRGDTLRLQEKLKNIQLTAARVKERKSQILDQRIQNNSADMYHAHTIQKQLKPEMSVKPSALWQQRQGFKSTASVLRGEQLLDRVQGKRAGEQVHADSLVNRHDFSMALKDTTPDCKPNNITVHEDRIQTKETSTNKILKTSIAATLSNLQHNNIWTESDSARSEEIPT